MEENFEKNVQERAVLVGLNADCFTKEQTATDETLEELEALLETAGGFCTGKILQNRHTPDSHSFIGEGKAQEVKMLVEFTQSTMVVFDNELSPGNIRALEEIIGVTVLDRSALILDIFAQRAKTKEGRLQVELAQYKYLLPRLAGMGLSLSRQGGGIGTRGPGETKLESDRRHIRERINRLEGELEQVRKVRSVQRERRMKNSVPVVAIVGYTNAGKSTLLNTMTDAGILAEDQLFATLDPTTRTLELPGGESVLMTDTVGFIRKLPHHLIEAFKSTLEEAKYADIILHVVDCSNPQADTQMHVVYETLKSLGVNDKVMITLFNKCDRPGCDTSIRDFQADHILKISAATGQGLDDVKELLAKILRDRKIYVERFYPYKDAGKVQIIRKYGQLLSEEYLDEGIAVTAYVPVEVIEKV